MSDDWASLAKVQIEEATSRIQSYTKIAEPDFIEIYEKIRTITMLSFEKLLDLYNSIKYINRISLPGSIIEIGTWKGGSLAMAMLADSTNRREFIGFDTFEGHLRPPKSEFDIRGNRLQEIWDRENKHGKKMAYSSIEECEGNLMGLKKLTQNLKLVKGDVRSTLQSNLPEAISILRIDCDWHSETLHTLNYLWERLSLGGVLYLDAFGHISGMKQAYIDFFQGKNIKYTHVDYAGVVIVKT